jgi:hypothetical protein
MAMSTIPYIQEGTHAVRVVVVVVVECNMIAKLGYIVDH